MKKYLFTIIFYLLPFIPMCQELNNGDVEIINSGKPVTNEMIFYNQYGLKKSKKLLFFVNNKQVECISYYNREELKKITVLQPKEAVKKYGSKGKNGAVIVQLKEEVKTPEIIITTNRLYYKCEIEGKLVDTTEMYYEGINKKNCSTLDLRDTSAQQTFYTNFDNKIRVKNLGVGWDRATIAIMRGRLTRGTEMGSYIVRVDHEENAKIVISTSEGTQKEIIFKIAKLPELIK